MYEREIMNRERTWLYAFIADRSVATQMGKPYSISKEDFIIRSAKTWWHEPGSQKTDVGLSAMVEMHRIVVRSERSSLGGRRGEGGALIALGLLLGGSRGGSLIRFIRIRHRCRG